MYLCGGLLGEANEIDINNEERKNKPKVEKIRLGALVLLTVRKEKCAPADTSQFLFLLSYFLFELGEKDHFAALWIPGSCRYARVYGMIGSGRTLNFRTSIAAITSLSYAAHAWDERTDACP